MYACECVCMFVCVGVCVICALYRYTTALCVRVAEVLQVCVCVCVGVGVTPACNSAS